MSNQQLLLSAALLLAAAGAGTFGSESLVAKPRDAKWPFTPVGLPEIPPVESNAWPRNPIDCFILAKLEEQRLEPSPEADRAALIRRLSFDLLGLPPEPQEIDAFVADRSPSAYERLVDRMLASPRYGERWARHWLDVARYTESQGFEYDHPRPNAWHYRDYVINSFNRDKRYDQFVREQIAGDAMQPVTPERLIATSLLVCGPWDQAGNSQANATQKAITREEELEDLISVVSQSFLGLTVNCARCHAHKFDPIPQADYYRIKSVFEGVRHGERSIATERQTREHDAHAAPLQKIIGQAEQAIAKLDEAVRRRMMAGNAGPSLSEKDVSEKALQAAMTEAERDQREELRRELERARSDLKAIPSLPVTYAGVRKQPEPTQRLNRGDVKSPDEIVSPGALSAVTLPDPDFHLPPDAPESERRLKLADWIADARNPLTPRVIVNRLWHYHFGRGLVETPNDFGAGGAKPSHPELLDWLAATLVREGWSLKQLQRLIVCSATYRQASGFKATAANIDADDRLLWRFPPRRLEGEALRDAMLTVSGQINWAASGPSVRPFDTKSFNATFYIPKDKIGPEFNRRTIYRMNVNSGKDPLLDVFDCPDPSVKTPRRTVTTTPMQALGLMNDSFVQRQAGHLAQRALAETGGQLPDSIRFAYRCVMGRLPTPDELQRAADVAEKTDFTNVCWALLNATEFIYVQ